MTKPAEEYRSRRPYARISGRA